MTAISLQHGIRIAGFVLISAGFLATAPDRVRAQAVLDTAGRFAVQHHRVLSGFDRDNIRGVFFRDSLNGFINGAFASVDGGRTWSRLPAPVPVPHALRADRFGVAVSGMISVDSGATWTRVPTPLGLPGHEGFDSTLMCAASSPRRIVLAAAYTDTFISPADGKQKRLQCTRLVMTTDGGATWSRLDSAAPVVYANGDLVASVFAPSLLPRPDSIPDPAYTWLRLIDMPDGITIRALIGVHDRRRDGAGSIFYVGRINPAARTAEWHALPFERGVDFHRVPQEAIVLKVDGRLISVLSLSHASNGEPNRMHISTDEGRTWSTIDRPRWVSMSGARAFSATVVAAPNARTADGGATWTPWSDPFHTRSIYNWFDPTRQFHAVTATSYLITEERTVGRTTDGGVSWSRNGAWDHPFGVIARGGTVIATYMRRAIARSIDSGRTWHDIGAADSSLPDRVGIVSAPAFTEAGDRSDGVAAIAQVVGDSTAYMACIGSTDGGRTWRERGRIPGLDSLAMQWSFLGQGAWLSAYRRETDGHVLFLGLTGRLLASEDDGATWELRREDTIRAMAMVDADHGCALTFDRSAGVWLALVTVDGWRTADAVATSFTASEAPLELVAADGGRYRVLFPTSAHESSDGGATWSVIHESTALPRPNDGTVHRLDARRLYVIDNEYFYYSEDGGRTYAHARYLDGNLPYTNAALTASDSAFIYFVSSANGIARWSLRGAPAAGIGGARSRNDREIGLNGLIAADGMLVMRLRLPRAAEVSVEIVDMRGVCVRCVRVGRSDSGDRVVRVGVQGLPIGAYVAAVRADECLAARPFAVMR